jgi:rubrerythrin
MGDFDDFLAFIIVLLGAAVVIKIIDDATKSTRYQCPNCGTVVEKGTNPCPNCKTPLRWF